MPDAPFELPLLAATLPMLLIRLSLTLPSRRLVAVALEVLNEFDRFEVEVAPLFAAEVPVPAALDAPELRFWPDESRELLSELSLLSVLVVVLVVVFVLVRWLLSERSLLSVFVVERLLLSVFVVERSLLSVLVVVRWLLSERSLLSVRVRVLLFVLSVVLVLLFD
jgi:hypothetical protein